MAEIVELRLIEEIDKLFGVIYRSAQLSSASVFDPEIIELIKPLLSTILIESDDQIDKELASWFECLLQKAVKRFKMRVIQIDFVERHQITRLQRLFDIRSILQEYWERERRAMGFIQLWRKLKRKCVFQLSQELLLRRLHQMGFQLVYSHSRETVHELPSQRLGRLEYIRAVRKHRDNDRNLLYFREATINYMRWNLCESNPSLAETTKTVIAYIAATQSAGLVDFMFTGNDHQMTLEAYVEWLKSVAKTQAPNTLILLDPKNYYHNGAPLATEEPVDKDNTAQSDDQIANVVSALVGHEILFIPSNHSELNPLHCIDFEHIIDGNGLEKADLITEEYLKNGARHRLNSTTDDEWKHFFENVQKNEENFLRFEAFLDDDAICVDDLQDSEESDVEIIEEINDNVIHLSDNDEIIVL